MNRFIDHVEADSLSKFTETAYKSLNSKKEHILENEKVEAGLNFFKEDSSDEECNDEDQDEDGSYDEEDPNFDIEIDPEEYSDDDISDLESIVWDDETMEDADEDVDFENNELDLTYEQMVYALEHFEELDEISKKTLGSYINKASGRMYGYGHEKASRQSDYDEKQRKLNDVDHNADMETKDHIRKVGDGLMKHHNKEQSKTAKKAYNRDQGIKRAVHRLTKEEIEHLEELSKKTLGNYIKDAHRDSSSISRERGFKSGMGTTNKQENDYFRRKAKNRRKGIDLAVNKLSKD